MHYHMGIDNIIFIGLVAMLFRYLWKLGAAALAGADGALGQFGVAAGGLAQ